MFEIPNIRHLRVFLEVVECKSISKASERVFLSQPAITQAIAKLETTMGTSLFSRRSDGMYVSESGEVFALRIRRALDMVLGQSLFFFLLFDLNGQIIDRFRTPVCAFGHTAH